MSPSIDTLDNIRSLDRMIEIENEGPMCDLLWSDPEEMEGWGLSNSGAGYIFGEDITQNFLSENKLKLIVRSRQICYNGYQYHHNNRLITIYSCKSQTICKKLAFLEVDEQIKVNPIQFNPGKLIEKRSYKGEEKKNFWFN